MSAYREEDQKNRVFLSRSSTEHVSDKTLRRYLQQRTDLEVFDSATVSAGGDWRGELRDRIADCDTFLLLIGEREPSDYAMQELGGAWALGKRMVVVRVSADGHLPPWSPPFTTRIVSLRVDDLEDTKNLTEIARSLVRRQPETAA